VDAPTFVILTTLIVFWMLQTVSDRNRRCDLKTTSVRCWVRTLVGEYTTRGTRRSSKRNFFQVIGCYINSNTNSDNDALGDADSQLLVGTELSRERCCRRVVAICRRHVDRRIRIAQEIAWAERCNVRFPSLLKHCAQPHRPVLNVKYSVRRFALRKADVFRAEMTNRPADAGIR
jgi:hypothetical protein